jgi:uncharacterized protein (DUF1697 family)
MTKYVALLRGINVGGNNKVEMKQLRAVFEALKFSNVATYINSGNVIFSSPRKDAKNFVSEIEAAFQKSFGFAVRVIVRDEKNFRAIEKSIPKGWINDIKQRTEIMFLWDEFAKKSTLKLIATNPDIDTLLYAGGAVVWHIADRTHYSKSGLRKFISTDVYRHMTARNVNTLRNIIALMN